MSARRSFEARVRFSRHDGEWRWFEARGNPLAAGRMSGYIGISLDITEIVEFQNA